MIEPIMQNPYGFKHVNQNDEIILALDKLARNPDHFVLLAGPPGTGKTFAAKACLRACDAHFRHIPFDATYVVNVPELNLEWSQKTETYEDKIYYANRAKLLLIDDLGFRSPTDSFLQVLYILINRRCEEGMGTLITTNLNEVQMQFQLGDAMLSRICSGKIFKMEGKDRRAKDI